MTALGLLKTEVRSFAAHCDVPLWSSCSWRCLLPAQPQSHYRSLVFSCFSFRRLLQNLSAFIFELICKLLLKYLQSWVVILFIEWVEHIKGTLQFLRENTSWLYHKIICMWSIKLLVKTLPTYTKLLEILAYNKHFIKDYVQHNMQLWKLLVSIFIFTVICVSWSLSPFWFCKLVILSLNAFLRGSICISTVKSTGIF